MPILIVIFTVFNTTFDTSRAPRHVAFRMRQFTRKWGTNLDTDAPVAVRYMAMEAMRRHGIPGTAIQYP
jgi:hypothetical protein